MSMRNLKRKTEVVKARQTRWAVATRCCKPSRGHAPRNAVTVTAYWTHYVLTLLHTSSKEVFLELGVTLQYVPMKYRKKYHTVSRIEVGDYKENEQNIRQLLEYYSCELYKEKRWWKGKCFAICVKYGAVIGILKLSIVREFFVICVKYWALTVINKVVNCWKRRDDRKGNVSLSVLNITYWNVEVVSCRKKRDNT